MSAALVPAYDADEIERFETIDAAELRFGDLLPYFGEHVRSVSNDGAMVRVSYLLRPGRPQRRHAFYPGERVTVLRAGSMRGVA